MSTSTALRIKAPARIDLAGGTLDVYPLYLFEEGGLTLNAAVSLYSHVTIQQRDDGAVLLHSEDMEASESYDCLDEVRTDGPLALLARAVRYYAPEGGIEIRTRNDAPHGSGLGASSALLMALSVGLNHFRGGEASFDDFIDAGANLEAQVIKIPTGKQDYYSALYGGVSALQFGVQGHARTALCKSQAARTFLESHLILSFTGVSHFSGANNWEMLRNYIDGKPETRAALARIRETARALCACLEAECWDDFPRIVAQEWQNRRELAVGVSTPEIDALMAAAEEAGAEASKLCGAGGGGCMITFARPERRSAVESALCAAGADVLPFTLDLDGVVVQECESI